MSMCISKKLREHIKNFDDDLNETKRNITTITKKVSTCKGILYEERERERKRDFSIILLLFLGKIRSFSLSLSL